ncbi:MAG: PAS domain S-box protein [Chloroflexi bacterium]|nr:PAS domain S-box protein [Chloroflexota bacterium]
MKGTEKTKGQLIKELDSLRQRVAELEAMEAEHERAGQELKLRDQILEKSIQILESAIDPVFLHDVEGNLIYVNEAAAKSHGYTIEELMKINLYKLETPESSELVEPRIKKILEQGSDLFEVRHYCKDGSVVPFEMHTRTIEVDGNTFFFTAARDISERKRVEETLRDREERYRYLFEHSQVANALVGLDGKIIDANESAAALYGYDKSEVIGKDLLEFISPESKAKVAEAFAQGLQHTPAESVDVDVIAKGDIRTFFYPGGYHLVFEGGKEIGFLISAVDVTERKKAEEALRHSEERYRTILEEMEDGYFEVDLAGNFIFVNDALCRQLGYSREELIGMNYRAIIASDDVKNVYRAFNQIYREGQPIRDFNFKTVRKDDSIGHGELAVFPLRDEKGEIIGFRGVGRDIAERLQMEDALRRSEERYRTVLEEMEEAYYEMDLAGNFTFFSDALCHHLGYSREELMGMNYRVFTPPENIKKVFETYNNVYRTGESIKMFPMERIRKDGTRKLAEASVFPLRNDKGEIIGFRGVGRDVTERLQMIEALRRSEERYRTMLDEMKEAYYEVDLAGNFTFFSDALCQQLGYSREELTGMSYKAYTPSENTKKVFEAYNKVYRTGEPLKLFHSEQIRKDGTRILTEDAVFPLRDENGGIIGFRGVSRDITERKLAEEALQESEEKFRTLAEESPNMIFINKMGPVVYANMKCEEVMGYTREELCSHDFDFITLIAPEFREQVRVAFERHKKGFESEQLEYTLLTKDGRRVNSILATKLITYGGGHAILGMITDITERKKAEQELRQLEQRAQFSSRLASVGELASGVAHEINNPLTAVIGYAHLLLDRKDIPEDIRRDVEVINEGAQRVAGIIRKMLIFARQTKPERTYVDVNEIINTTLDLRAYSLQNNNVKVVLQLDPDLPMTVADPGQLQQVFLNLIMNAETEVKLAHGGGKLAIKTEEMDNNIRVSFKDNGLGIAKENLEKIFNPFFTTRKVGQGTGLGLSVCHGIVNEHKGRIWAESHLGKGATLIVELPIVTEHKQLEMPEPVIEEPHKVLKAKILVVDDEAVIRQFVSQMLMDEGHEVEALDSAEDALEQVKSKEYQVIMLDIKMPGMNGIELYRHFQKISLALAERVVFITGDVMGASTMAFLSKTKAPYIIKPFDAKQLKIEVNRILVRG